MGNMADQNRFWLAKWSNWSENGQWPTVISSTALPKKYPSLKAGHLIKHAMVRTVAPFKMPQQILP